MYTSLFLRPLLNVGLSTLSLQGTKAASSTFDLELDLKMMSIACYRITMDSRLLKDVVA